MSQRYKPNVTVACIIHATSQDKYLLVKSGLMASSALTSQRVT